MHRALWKFSEGPSWLFRRVLIYISMWGNYLRMGKNHPRGLKGRMSILIQGHKQWLFLPARQKKHSWFPGYYLEYKEGFLPQVSSVAQSCPTLCNPMNCSTPGLPVHQELPEFYSNSCPSSWWCHPAISSSVVPFSSCPQSLPASGSFQWVNTSHEVAKVLEFQLQHQSFQWTPRTDLL